MKEKEVKAILVIIVGLLVFYTYFLVRKNNSIDELLYAALGIGVLSLLFPIVGKGIVWIWYKIAEVLGWINSRILLGLLFFVFLTPLSLMYRLFKRNTLNVKAPEHSVFDERNYSYKAEDLENPW